MFRKRIKKEFPPGTFIPTSARVLAILQLCLAFSLLIWQMSQPFLGDLFRVKSQMLSYQNVMGIHSHSDLLSEYQERLQRNAQRFIALSSTEKEKLIEDYTRLENQLHYTLKQKITRLMHLVAYEKSSFELAWIFFSVLLSILLLKRIEGARHALWILPALAFFFLVENTSIKNPLPKEDAFFPSEQKIVQEYLQESLSTDIFKQREQLLQGWNLYLITEWAQEIPSENSLTFQEQAEKGEFLFNVNRLLSAKKIDSSDAQSKESTFLLCLYLIWNLFFAWYTNRLLHQEKCIPLVSRL